MAVHCHNTPGLPDQTGRLILPRVKRDELYDDIVLAIDAIEHPPHAREDGRPTREDACECAGYLRHALRIIRGTA